MKQVDMSSEAIMSRLRQTEKLRQLCLALMKAKKIGDAKNASHSDLPSASVSET